MALEFARRSGRTRQALKDDNANWHSEQRELPQHLSELCGVSV
jgi:hypothetical protein